MKLFTLTVLVLSMFLKNKRFIGYKDIKTNIFRIQAYNSRMHGYFCIGFIDFMFMDKTLIEYTSLFSPYDFKKNDKTILDFLK